VFPALGALVRIGASSGLSCPPLFLPRILLINTLHDYELIRSEPIVLWVGPVVARIGKGRQSGW
jgi:hypothetical protein